MTDVDKMVRHAAAAAKRKDWPEAVRLWSAVVDHHGGPNAPKKIRAQLWRARQLKNSEEALRENRLSFRALADASKPILVNPHLIRRKVRGELDLDLYPNAILPGDWDLDPLVVDETFKHRSVRQHFVDGLPWRDTEMFGFYVHSLQAGKVVRGRRTIDELLEDYREVDALYESMKERGFALPDHQKNRVEALPHVHIGRAGEILYGRAGNHRLAIAKILNLDHITCLVHARHLDWQNLRERLFGIARENRHTQLEPELAGHPDLTDLVG